MFGTAWSQIGATGSRTLCSRGYSLLCATVVYRDLAGSDSVDLALVVDVRVAEVNLVVLSVSPLHHVVVMYGWDVLISAAQALGWEHLLLGTYNVDAFFRIVHLLLQYVQEVRVGLHLHPESVQHQIHVLYLHVLSRELCFRLSHIHLQVQKTVQVVASGHLLYFTFSHLLKLFQL